MNIVDDEQHAAVARGGLEHGDEGLEQSKLRLCGITSWRRGIGQRELGEEQAELSRRSAELGMDLFGRTPGEVVADRLDERQVRRRHLRFRAAPPEDVPPQPACSVGELVRESRLAHPRLALDEHEPATPVALD